MVRISPSVLSCDFLNLGADIKMMMDSGIDILHMDIMDGMYVPNISYGPMILKQIKDKYDIALDTHLMIMEPNRYFDVFKDTGTEYLTIHAEASTHLERDLNKIKELGMKAGLAINPGTSPETIRYVLDVVDMVLVMSVNPGFGGQKFIPSASQKIKEIRQMLNQIDSEAIIEVDGGIVASNVLDVAKAGADMVVSGSGLLKGDFESNLKAFKDQLCKL